MASYNPKIAKKYFPKERKKMDTVRDGFSGLRMK
jgi:hypothetical protein